MRNTILDWYWGERGRAIKKHGFINTPENKEMFPEKKLVILAEEFGEVARAMTYDEGDQEDLKKELIQLGTMAFMWAMSMEGPSVEE
jgi:NTP pyrophosphatase (non-canonical NTP hydrolase)